MNLGQLISLVYLASGLILFILSWMILRENPKNRLNRIVSMMLFFAGLAPLATALYKSILEGNTGIPSWLTNSFYLWELFFPALLYFSAIFPEPQPIYKSHKKLLQLAFTPHLLHLFLVIFLSDPDKVLGLLNAQSQIPILGEILRFLMNILRIITAFFGFLMLFHTRFFSIVNLIYVVATIYLLLLGYKKIENPRLRQQVKVILIGILMAIGLYTLGFIIPNIISISLPPGWRDAMVVASLIVGPGSIAWAIVRYQFMDIGLIARRSLVYSIATAVVVGGYLLIVFQLNSVVKAVLGQESLILNILIIIIMLLFFQPIYTQVDDFVRRIFIRMKGDYSSLVESFSRQILTIFQKDKLVNVISHIFEKEMFIENIEVAFPEGDKYFKVISRIRPESRFEIEAGISDYLLSKQAPCFTEEFSSRSQTNYLGKEIVSRGFQVVVPLVRQEKLSGLLLLSSKVAGFRYSSEDITFLSTMANQIVVAMENAELYTEAIEKQRLEEELSVAKQIQIGLLPRSLPEMKNFKFAAFIEPSRQVGGDFYDFIPISDGRFGVVIADASGKGVPAALLIARMQAVLQSEAKTGKDLSQIITSVNRFIFESTSADRFATAFYCEIDDKNRKLYYCNAGHNYPILVHKDGTIETLEKGGLLLGVFNDSKYEMAQADMAPGDLLLLYTDGINEAKDKDDKEFGEHRLIQVVKEFRSHPSEIICSNIVKNVKQYAAGIEDMDDMTLVVIKSLE